MSAQLCAKQLNEYVKLVQFQKDFMLTLCVLHFVFSPVAALGNLPVIRALWKASSIPANVRKLFLSLAFSDLAVGMFLQPMTAAIHLWLKMASTRRIDMCPICFNIYTYCNFFLTLISFLNIIAISVDRLLAILLHLRYQELVTSKRVIIALVSLWLISGAAASVYNLLPKDNDILPVICALAGLLLTTAVYIRIYKVVWQHQNQIQSQLQMQNVQAVELLRQKKSAYTSLFVYLVFLACYLPFTTSQILYVSNSLRISFWMSRSASIFLVHLNSSFNPLVYCWRYRENTPNCEKHNKENFSH